MAITIKSQLVLSLLLGSLLALPPQLGGAATEGELAPGFVNPGHVEAPPWFKVSFLDLAEDVAEAAAANKRVILYFHQDGCPYCKRLIEDNFGQQGIARKTQAGFEVVSINMWGDREVTDLAGQVTTEKALATQFKVMFTPTLLFLDKQGEVVLRLNGYVAPHDFSAVLDYIASGRTGRQGLREFLSRQSLRKASGRLHQQSGYLPWPLDLTKRDKSKPLLVLFEQKVCADCDTLHGDIFRRPGSAQLLSQFDIALVDMRGSDPLLTPDGRRLSGESWARERDILYGPSLLFFDADGNEIFRAEAYLRTFHIQSALAYVASGAYRSEPSFQRFVQARADEMRARGIEIDLME